MKRSLGGNGIPLFIIAALIAVNTARGMLGISVLRTAAPGGYCQTHRMALKRGVVPLTGCPRQADPMESRWYPNAATSTTLFEAGWEERACSHYLSLPEYGEVWYCPRCRQAKELYRSSRRR